MRLHQSRGDRQNPGPETAGQRRVGTRHPVVGPAVRHVEDPRQVGLVDANRRCRRRGPTHRFSSDPSASETLPPAGVCAIAFATRFDSTRTNARSLPSTRTRFSPAGRLSTPRPHAPRRSGARPAHRRRPRPVPPCRNAGCTAPAVDLRHLEQIVDHLGEPNRLLFNRFSRAPGLRNRETTPSAIASDNRPDPCQRCAQVMADERDEPAS